IYAEDPKTFMPSTGTITALNAPKGQYIRNELAVRSGSLVTPFYDPMIGKLSIKGADREEAIKRLKTALSEYKIEGIKTNIPMLRKILDNEQFQNGNTTTAFVQEYYLPQTQG